MLGVSRSMETGQRPNRQLRLQRRLRGWSQEDVAAGLHRLAASRGERELGVDAAMVSRWERGSRRPRPRYMSLLCRLFELPAEQLGIVDEDEYARPREPMRDGLEDDVERRDFMQRMATLLGAATVPMPNFEPGSPEPWKRLAMVLRRPGPVDDTTVEHLEQITVALQSLAPTQLSARAILGPVTGHLDAITLLLQGSSPPALRARLCSLAAETAGLAGWLRWDLDDPDGAASYFATGLQAAREGGDRALAAYLSGSAACQPPYRETPQRRLQQLRSISWAEASPSGQVWLAAKEADACALMGDASGCARALDRAEVALEGTAGEGGARRPRFSPVDRGWLDGEHGASLARLGRTGEARAYLEPALARLGQSSERDWLWLGTALASTYVSDREPEEACHVASAVLERASRMQLQPVMKLVKGLRQQLGSFGPSTATRELDEQLRGLGGSLAAG
jgi:transcriptional regulator with XRE-family HTH domain